MPYNQAFRLLSFFDVLNQYLSGLIRIISSITFPFIILNGYVVIAKLVFNGRAEQLFIGNVSQILIRYPN